MAQPSPLFTHDCAKCDYLGTTVDTDTPDRIAWVDLYVCRNGALGPSVIARFGDSGGDYVSSPASYVQDRRGVHDTLMVAKILAGL